MVKIDSKRRWLARARLGGFVPDTAIETYGEKFFNRLLKIGCERLYSSYGYKAPTKINTGIIRLSAA